MKIDRRLMRLLRGDRGTLALNVGLGLGGGLATVGQALSLAAALDSVFRLGASVPDLLVYLALFAVATLARAGCRWGVETSAERLSVSARGQLRRALLEHLSRLGPAWVAGERAGEVTAVLGEGVEQLRAWYARFLPQLFQAAIVPLTLWVVVAPLDWISGLILGLTAPLIPVFMILIGSHAKGKVQAQWGELSRMSAHLLSVLQVLPVLRALGRAREHAAEIQRVARRYGAANLAVLRIAFLSALALELLATLSVALVAVGVGLRLLDGGLTFYQAVVVLILAPEFYNPLRALGASFHASMTGAEASGRIHQILDTPAPAPCEGCQPVPERPGLRLEGVGFSYDPEGPPALEGVDLDIGPGQTVALVGSSGSGKTTLTRLLLGFLRPTQGQVLVEGLALGQLDLAAWRARVGWVSQQPHLFAGSVADNIRLARPEAGLDEVVQAGRAAGLHDEIMALPKGYHTPAGEAGALLSGGQAQRVALARALLAGGDVLVLDEVTAHLDAATEARVHQTLRELDRTVILCAHRLETVREADQIVVLEGGRVVERGPHEELVALGGRYAELVGRGDKPRAYDDAPPRSRRVDPAGPGGEE